MPGSITGQTQPWFTVNEHLSKNISSGEVIEVGSITAVSFDEEVNITIGSLGTPFNIPVGTALGIDTSTSQFSIDTDAFMFAMGGR